MKRFKKDEIEEIKNELIKHYHNHRNVVEKKTGLSRNTVHKFFKTEHINVLNAYKIHDACLELIDEAYQREERRKKDIQRMRKIRDEQNLD